MSVCVDPFSSLFLGIRFATLESHFWQAVYDDFQFPFPRDSLCDIIVENPLEGWPLDFQFPFPRDSLCDYALKVLVSNF